MTKHEEHAKAAEELLALVKKATGPLGPGMPADPGILMLQAANVHATLSTYYALPELVGNVLRVLYGIDDDTEMVSEPEFAAKLAEADNR